MTVDFLVATAASTTTILAGLLLWGLRAARVDFPDPLVRGDDLDGRQDRTQA